MFAPVSTTATFLPFISCLILSKPASPKAPEGSLMIPIEYSLITICATFPYEIFTNPSTDVVAMPFIMSFVYFTDVPLQNLLTFSAVVNFPFIIDVENGVAISV